MAETRLKRKVTLLWLTFYGLGNILGAGIYVLVGKIAGVAGIHAPVAFLVSAALVLLTALSYTELSARYPLSAGEAVYIQQGFGFVPLSVLVGLLIATMGMVAAAGITRGAVGYLAEFLVLPEPLVIVVILLAMGGLAVWGIGASVKFASLLTLVELLGLLLVIWVGRHALLQVPERLPELLPTTEEGVWVGILLGALLAFFAFTGFEDMVNIAEEVREPQRTMPWAILLALIVTVVLYLLVTLVLVMNLSPQQLSASDAPLALIYREITGKEPLVITGISLFAVINGVLIQIVMASRIFYGMAHRGWGPRWLAEVHPVTRTPAVATVLVVLIVLGLAIWQPLLVLAKVSSMILLMIFSLTNLALWRIKRREPRPVGVRVVPTWVPLLGFFASALFLIYSLWRMLSG